MITWLSSPNLDEKSSMNKSKYMVIAEGTLYAVIAGGAPWAEYLQSDKEIDERSLLAVAVVSLLAAAISLKAYLSQSMSTTK